MLSGTEVIDWINGIELLSLDFTRPVFSDLGVGVGVELGETIRSLARDTLIGKYSGQKEPFELGSWSDPEVTWTVWIAPFISAVERAIGSTERRKIEHWIRYTVCTEEDRNPWIVYDNVLSKWASIVRRTDVDPIGFSADAATIAREMKLICDVTEPTNLLAKQAARALTDWDLPRFARLGLFEIPHGSDFFPFVDAIILTIRMSRFQRFWLWLLSYLSPSDLELIASAASSLAKEEGVPYRHPGQLDLP
jgi:hypothetical protein